MKKHTQWYTSLLKSVQLQLFISFISLPFLIGWGLPISLVMPISTLMFSPFLTCFLLVSSLIFFLELFYIPNALFIWCLEQITTIWLACLNLEQRAWLIGFQKPSIIVLLCIPFIALALVHSKKIITMKTRTGLLALLLITTCAALKLFPYAQHNHIIHIACNKGDITLAHHTNIVTMIDPGYMSSRPNYESFILYTLVPEIVQKTGTMQIDHLVIGKLNKRMLDAVQFLATKMVIKNVYIPAWNGKIPSFAWRSYVALKKTMLAENGKLHSISYKKQLKHGTDYTIFIEPSQTKNICYYDATYKPLCINGTINTQTFSL
jgi:hypothetical protein